MKTEIRIGTRSIFAVLFIATALSNSGTSARAATPTKPGYVVQDLGLLDGYTDTRATSLAKSGSQVYVAGWATNSTGQTRVWLWEKSTNTMTDLNMQSTGYTPATYGSYVPFYSYYYYWFDYYYGGGYFGDYDYAYYGLHYRDPHAQVSSSGQVAVNGVNPAANHRIWLKRSKTSSWIMLLPNYNSVMTYMSKGGRIAGTSSGTLPCNPAGWLWPWPGDPTPEDPSPWYYAQAGVWTASYPSEFAPMPLNQMDCTDCDWWSDSWWADHFDNTCGPFSFPGNVVAVEDGANGGGTAVGTMWSWWWGLWGWYGHWYWWEPNHPDFDPASECCTNWLVGAYVFTTSDSKYTPMFTDRCTNAHVFPIDINSSSVVLAGSYPASCTRPSLPPYFLWHKWGTQEPSVQPVPANIQPIAINGGTSPSVIGFLTDGRPVVWESGTNKTRILSELICGDYELNEITDINDAGQLVGSASIDGHDHAVLLTPYNVNNTGDYYADEDDDTWPDKCDNCSPTDPLHSRTCTGEECENEDQADLDLDSIGDVCDNCPKDKNGPNEPDPQKDSDADKVGDKCDNCQGLSNGRKEYKNGDSIGECARTKNLIVNDKWQPDADCEGIGDACDNCPMKENVRVRYAAGASLDECAPAKGLVKDGFWQPDYDCDGVGDLCDPCPKDANNRCLLEPPFLCKKQPEGENHEIDPVYLFSGEFYLEETDLSIPVRGMTIEWGRKYRSRVEIDSAIGKQWDFSYNVWLEQKGSNYWLHNGHARYDEFVADGTGTWRAPGVFSELKQIDANNLELHFPDHTRWKFSASTSWRIAQIIDRNNNTLTFGYVDGLLRTITADGVGRTITIDYVDIDGVLRIQKVTDWASRSVEYGYYRNIDVGVGGLSGDLWWVKKPEVTGTPTGNDFAGTSRKMTKYTYYTGFADDRLNHNLRSIVDPNGKTYLTNFYSSVSGVDYDRIYCQVWGDYTTEKADSIQLFYKALPGNPNVPHDPTIQVIVNDRVGNVKEYFYDSRNLGVNERVYVNRAPNPDAITTTTLNRPFPPATGPEYYETRFEYNSDYLLKRTYHPAGNVTENRYELDVAPNSSVPYVKRANLREIHHRKEAHPVAVQSDQEDIVEHFTYKPDVGGCCLNMLESYTDEYGNRTEYSYDDSGNTTEVRHKGTVDVFENFTYVDGQLDTHTLPPNESSNSGHRRVDKFVYFGASDGYKDGYLKQQIVDYTESGATPAGLNIVTEFDCDSVGNIIRITALPDGRQTSLFVNQLNEVCQTTVHGVDVGGGLLKDFVTDTYYDANGNVVKTVQSGYNSQGVADSVTHLYRYDILNYLVRVLALDVDREVPGHTVVTEYEYDDNRNRTLIRYGEATGGDELVTTSGEQPHNTVTTSYNSRNQPSYIYEAAGDDLVQWRRLQYDANGNVVQITEGDQVTTRQVDHFGRVTQVQDSMGNVTEHAYDLAGKKTKTSIYGELVDVPGTTGNALLSETTVHHDQMRRDWKTEKKLFNAFPPSPGPILTDHDQNGYAFTTVEYTGTSQVHSITDDRLNQTIRTYDRANRLHSVSDARENTSTYGYDRDGNVNRVDRLEVSDQSAPSQTFVTTRTYDRLGRLQLETDNLNNSGQYYYDALSNLELAIDKNGNEISYLHDRLNRLCKTVHKMTPLGPGGGSSYPIVTRQIWDDSSRLVGRVDGNGNLTTYVFDPLNRLAQTIYEDGTAEIITPDAHGNPHIVTDPNGTVITNTHDALNRLSNRIISAASGVAPSPLPEQFSYDGLSRLVFAQDGESQVHRTYDSLGNTLTDKLIISKPDGGTVEGTATSTHDGVGNRISLSYPGSRRVDFTPDPLNRLKKITEGTLEHEYFYVGSRVERRKVANGAHLDTTFDGLGRPDLAASYKSSGTKINDLDFGWDNESNKKSRQHSKIALTTVTTSDTVNYDSLYRLQDRTQAWSTGSPVTNAYIYDFVANRVHGNAPASWTSTYTLTAGAPLFDFEQNQYTATPFDAQQHDANGNLQSRRLRPLGDLDGDGDVDQDDYSTLVSSYTGPNVLLQDTPYRAADINVDDMVDFADLIVMQSNLLNGATGPASTMTYDYRNQMAEYIDGSTGKRHCYSYDALGRRIGKAVDVDGANQVTYYLYDGDRVLEERDGAGTLVTSYVYGRYIDEVLSSTRNGTVYYYHCDDLYNTTVVTGSTDRIAEWYEYNDFGEPIFLSPTLNRMSASAIGNTRLFNGREYDPETGLYYYRTRYLDPRTGRFTTRDTIGIWGDPMNMGNGYAYVGNNPWTNLDPQGTGGPWWWSKQQRDDADAFRKYRDQISGDPRLWDKPSALPPTSVGGNSYAPEWQRKLPVNYQAPAPDHRTMEPLYNVLDVIPPFAIGHGVKHAIERDYSGAAWRIGLGTAGTYAGLAKLGFIRCPGVTAAKGGVSLADDLAAAATRARNTVGPGSGGAYGTRAHSAFEAEVNGLGRGLQTEVSYLNGQVVPRGTPGSVRLDVVNGPLNAPTSIFDLKTGSATLTPGRIQQIQSHVPGGSGVPVYEVRP